MDTRIPPLLLSLALATGAAALLTACDPPEPVEASSSNAGIVPPAPRTTVGTEIDDTVITTKVKSALLDHQDTKAFDIKVETRKGVVLLSGFVDSPSQASAVVAVARGVEGVKDVENSTTLKAGKTTVGNKVDDSIVTAKVRSALLSDPEVKSLDIAVATRKGEVQLSGFVDNKAQVERAMQTTRDVEGVQTVVNAMSLKK